MTILVIDGQGGKLGKRLVESIKKSFPQVEVMAVGTNSAASESMMRAGADRWRPVKTRSLLPAGLPRSSLALWG